MKIKVLLFGMLTDITEKTSFELDEVSNVADLKSYLNKTYPKIKEINFSIARNKEIITNDTSFKDSDEIALLPPFAGG